MDFTLKFKVSEKIYLKDPETSEMGRQIISHSIQLIHDLGFESFTFKKLALGMDTTEATIYRYFENKHRLLLYIFNWYWSYLDYIITFHLQSKSTAQEKLNALIELLTVEIPLVGGKTYIDLAILQKVIIFESSKVYLVKEVKEINRSQVFKPYKDLCNTIAGIISVYNPSYKFAHSLSSTLIETAHNQQFFAQHLPRLTDVSTSNKLKYTTLFLKDLLFKAAS